jgi:hypothetical protein
MALLEDIGIGNQSLTVFYVTDDEVGTYDVVSEREGL